MSAKYLPFAVKMYREVVKITVIIWGDGNMDAMHQAREKYEGFTIYLIQAQWHYRNRMIAI
jgi:hypothetical protein